MKMNHIMVISVLLAGILTCMGCTIREDPETALINYMKGRYPNDTITLAPNQLHWGNPYESYCLYFTSEKIPERTIYASRSLKDGDYIYADNYIKYYLEDATNAYISEIAGKYFGECNSFVHYNPIEGTLPSSFPTDATAEDILHSGLHSLFVVYASPENITIEEAKENFNHFKSEFEECQFENVEAVVYLTPDAESYKKTNSRSGPSGEHDFLKKCNRVGCTSD